MTRDEFIQALQMEFSGEQLDTLIASAKAGVTAGSSVSAYDFARAWVDIKRGNSTSTAAPRWWHDLPPVIIISAILAITFGVLGLVPNLLSGASAGAAAGFVDIAKVFAGAVVGAAAAKR
jgi:hypothetical protein